MTDLPTNTPLEPVAPRIVDDVLPQQHFKDLLVAPDAPALPEAGDSDIEDVDPIDTTGEAPRSPRRRRIAIAVGTAAAAVAVAGGAFFAFKGGTNTGPTNNPSASSSETPSGTPTPETTANPGFTIEPLTTEKYPTPDKVTVAFDKDVVTAWYNAGATPDLKKQWLDGLQAGMDRDQHTKDFVTKIADSYDKQFIATYIIPDWKSHPNLANFVNNMIQNHYNTLTLYLQTLDNVAGGDTVPYARQGQVYGTPQLQPSSTGTQFTEIVSVSDTDNADQNRVGEALTNGTKVDPKPVTATDSFTLDGNSWKLSDAIAQQ